MNSAIALLFIVVASATTNGQQIIKVVTSHLDSAYQSTKEQLGYEVPVKGHTGYTTSVDGDDSPGVNLTFILSGRNLGIGLNPFVKLAFRSRFTSDLVNFGITESDVGSNDPDWNQVIWFIWKKGTLQKWHIKVLDHNTKGKLIGEGILDVESYVESGENSVVALDSGSGKILVKKTTPMKFKLSAKNLSRLDEFSSKSDPYVKVYYRKSENGPNIKIYTTSTIDNVVNADWWDIIEFSNYQRGTGQYLFFKVRDSDTITKDDHLGEVLINADEYDALKGPFSIHLENSGENSMLTITPILPDADKFAKQ